MMNGYFSVDRVTSTNTVDVGKRWVNDNIKEGISIRTWIKERNNYIEGEAGSLSKQSHILASNLDQALLIITVNYPETSTVFVDRFLASAEAYRIPVKIIINKIDLYDEADISYTDALINLYETIGYECLKVSAKTGEGIEDLKKLLSGKISLLSGNSGVGKSTLINAILPGINIKTANISDAHNTGMHTTTFSEMFELPGGGYIIDTPGVQGFGTFDFKKEEV